jgi:hypothetical protein
VRWLTRTRSDVASLSNRQNANRSVLELEHRALSKPNSLAHRMGEGWGEGSEIGTTFYQFEFRNSDVELNDNFSTVCAAGKNDALARGQPSPHGCHL